ncbi:hypothetical protein EES45_10885 [Streptomyces sp. ADI97-07]|nr:hypothetical protein EES45_10885 [Streptomyces sp. ADI97-07]
MRDFIAHVLVYLLRLVLPARGRHGAPAVEPEPVPTPPRIARPWGGPSSVQARAIFHAKETQALTVEQRERWWATAFAEIGVDYDFPTINIKAVRPPLQGVAA